MGRSKGKCGDAGQHGERRPNDRSVGAGMALVTAGAEDCLRRRCRGRAAAAPSHTTGMQFAAHRAMTDGAGNRLSSRCYHPAAAQTCRAEQDECPPHHGNQQGEQPIGNFSGKARHQWNCAISGAGSQRKVCASLAIRRVNQQMQPLRQFRRIAVLPCLIN